MNNSYPLYLGLNQKSEFALETVYKNNVKFLKIR